MHRGGEITAKEFNSSKEVTDALQNVILQHSDMRTFIQHYEVDVDVDVQPYRLPPEESKSLNELPVVRARQGILKIHKQKWNDRKSKFDRAHMAFQATVGHLVESALSKRHHHLKAKLELYQDRMMEAKPSQPIIDPERQLAGKLVDTKVMDALEHKGFMPPQHLVMIDAMLTMSGATIEAELQHQINDGPHLDLSNPAAGLYLMTNPTLLPNGNSIF
ncbi:hypothetical protein BDW75DRAFT_235086 [Aspergillus navahoensis]